MSALGQPPKIQMSPAEYLERELITEQKSQYLDGEVFAMAGASPNHIDLTGNIHALLWNQLRGRPCKPLMSDQRVRTPGGDLYTYPDVSVACNAEYESPGSILTNPVVIFEVLSPSTEDFDRGTKFNRYRTIPGLRDYILVAQHRIAIEHRSCHNGPLEDHWWVRILEDPEEELVLDSIGCRLKLADIYQGIDFNRSIDLEIESA